MTMVPLVEGAYQARGVIAAAQRCVNLYPEVNQRNVFLGWPQQITPTLVTHYPTPGLTKLTQGPVAEVRGLFRANNGSLYTVIGNSAYYVTPQWELQFLGILATSAGQVSMMDNGSGRTMVIVDNSPWGYTVDLPTNTFGTITDPAFYGSTKVDYLSSYLVFNKPGTQEFYCTLSNETPTTTTSAGSDASTEALNALYFAQKAGYGDNIVTFCSLNRLLWLFGERTAEIWYVSGGATFPFAATPSGLIQHGCAAKYSVASVVDTVIWLSVDMLGRPQVLQGSGYTANRISTNAIENEIQSYARFDDAIALVYQQDGHNFYQLTFPSADKTWVFDATPNVAEWHERASFGANGDAHRHRANCAAFAYGVNVVGDYENGTLYAYDLNNYTDNGQPIQRIRGFPHLISDAKRLTHSRFVADIQCGEASSTVTDVEVQLRWSDTRGRSWEDPIVQSIGLTGEFLTSVQWRRLGLARDRVYEVAWTFPGFTALNGAYVDIQSAAT